MPVSLEEVYGVPGVKPEEMPSAADQADEGFFQRAGHNIVDWYKLSSSHPVSAVTGVVKGLGAGAVSMGELAAKGVAGIATAYFTQTGMKGFEKGMASVDAWLEADRQASKGIMLINLAPKDKTEEAFQNFLGILPEGITAAGDTVYEKTGSAMAGAGAQTLLTALTLKPSMAAKPFSGVLKLAKGEPLTKAGKVGAEKVQAAFDELAVKDPQGATAIAEHVIQADPDLGMHLMKSIDDAGKRTAEDIGKKAAEADKPTEEPSHDTTFGLKTSDEGPNKFGAKVGRISEGNDRRLMIGPDGEYFWGEYKKGQKMGTGEEMIEGEHKDFEPAKFATAEEAKAAGNRTPLDRRSPGTAKAAPAEGVSKATREFTEATDLPEAMSRPPTEMSPITREVERRAVNEEYARQLKAQEREYTRSQLKHTEDNGEHSVDSPNGSTDAVESGNYLKVSYTATAETARGHGEGTLRMEKLIDIAAAKGLKLSSEPTVSAEQSRVYASLKKRGYIVKENPHVVNPDTGGKISLDPRVPVYEVSRPKPKPWNPKGAKFMPPEAPAYIDAGHPVTRASVERAFRTAKQLGDLPGVRVVVGKLSEYYHQIIRTVNPEALGPEAKTAASVLAKRIAEQMQKDSSQVHRAAERLKFWNHQPKSVINDFIKRFEKGEKFDDPTLQKAAEAYRRWGQEIFETDKKLGIEYEPVDNYLYHVFDDPPSVAEFFKKRFGSKWNNPGFIKERAFDLYAQAVKAGHKPRFTNPEDIMLARQHASNIAEMRVNALEEMRSAGIAQAVEKGIPDYPATEWRAPNGQRYWVHDSANAVLHNAFDTRSLWSMPGVVGDAFRSAMFLKNVIVPIKLALSLFHPLHVLTIDNATGMVRATKELLSGTKSPTSFVADMAKSTVYADIISNPKTGYRLLNAYKGKLPNPSATDLQALQFMAEGGFIPEMSSQYRIGAVAKLKTAIQRRSAAAAWHLPFAAIESLQHPMFQVWIPSLKIASYLKDVQTAIKTDPSLLDNPLKRQLAFRRLAKSIDNRYGEMAYNTLFWNRWVKDLAVANTLSLGWQMGFIREYGGGMLDVGQLATKKGGLREKVSTGMLDRPLFVTYYTAQALAYGGLMTWALTGQLPQDLKDYVYPRSGETLPDGRPEHLNTMFYPREIASIYKHMENEGVVSGLGHLASSKASGVVGMTTEWATGINSFDREIRDPDAPLYKQVEQTLASTLSGLEPISIGTIHNTKSENKTKTALLAVSGFSSAPKYVTETRTEALIKGTFRKYFAQRLTPFEKAQTSELRGDLKKAYENGDSEKYSETLDKLQEKFQMTGLEQRRLEQSVAKGEDPLVDMFKRLTWQQQVKILNQMTDEEREVFLPHSNKQHVRYTYEPPEIK